MTKNKLIEVMRLLPANARIFTTMRPVELLSEHQDDLQLLDRIISLPFAGWGIVRSFVQAKKPLPREITNLALHRYYQYEVNHNVNDLEVRLALRYSLPTNYMSFSIVTGFMLRGMTDKQLGDFFHEPPETFHIFDQLFMNIRDRKDEADYIRSLVYPNGLLETLKPDYLSTTDYGTFIRRALWTARDEKNALKWAGLQRPHEGALDAASHQSNLERNVMQAGDSLHDIGLGHTGAARPVRQAITIMTENKASGTQGGSTSSMDPSNTTIADTIAQELQELNPGDKPEFDKIDKAHGIKPKD